jgi:BirA family transcriptional regulator, biotin operon repressor / biotin---[acetyl-CoA-carboxylase] ligase
MSLGHPRLHHRRTDSTSERAKELAAAGAPHGTLVTADEQTAGRGRQGRTWTAPPGTAVLMSLVIRELDERGALLPLAAAVAVCDACAPVECRIKWPNDVWIGERKVAGILVEGRPQEGWAVLGIGLNVTTAEDDFPPELRATATSLAAAGEPPALEEVLAALLRSLESRLAERPESILAAWRERDALRGRRVRWDGGEGTAAGVSDGGALVVETDTGHVELDAGEVHLLR